MAIFKSVNDCKNFGYQPSCVSDCCRGKRETHKGLGWKYLNIDTKTKKRGWWRADGTVCSCCGYIRQQTRSGNYIVGDYCPKCGAEMKAEAIE